MNQAAAWASRPRELLKPRHPLQHHPPLPIPILNPMRIMQRTDHPKCTLGQVLLPLLRRLVAEINPAPQRLDCVNAAQLVDKKRTVAANASRVNLRERNRPREVQSAFSRRDGFWWASVQLLSCVVKSVDAALQLAPHVLAASIVIRIASNLGKFRHCVRRFDPRHIQVVSPLRKVAASSARHTHGPPLRRLACDKVVNRFKPACDLRACNGFKP